MSYERTDASLAGQLAATATEATVSSVTGIHLNWRVMTWIGMRSGISMAGRAGEGVALMVNCVGLLLTKET